MAEAPEEGRTERSRCEGCDPVRWRRTSHPFLEHVPGMMLVLDGQGVLVDGESTRPRIHRNDRCGHFAGRSGIGSIHDEDRASAVSAIDAAALARQHFQIECRRAHRGMMIFRWCTLVGPLAPDLPAQGGIHPSDQRRHTPAGPPRLNAGLASSRLQAIVGTLSEVCIGVGSDEEIVFWNKAAEAHSRGSRNRDDRPSA